MAVLASLLFAFGFVGCGAQQRAIMRFDSSTLPDEVSAGQIRAELFLTPDDKKQLAKVKDHAAEVQRGEAWCNNTLGFDYAGHCADTGIETLYHAEKVGFVPAMIRELALEAYGVHMRVSALTPQGNSWSGRPYWYAWRAARLARVYGLGRQKEITAALTAARQLADDFEKAWEYKFQGGVKSVEELKEAPDPNERDLKFALQLLNEWEVPGNEAERICKLVRDKGYITYLSSWHRDMVSDRDEMVKQHFDPFLLEQCGSTPEPDDFEKFGLQDDADEYLEGWDLAILKSLSHSNLMRFARAEISYCPKTANEILANGENIWGQVITLDQCARARLIYTAASEDIFQRVLNAEESWVYLMAYYDVYTRATAEMTDLTPGDLESQRLEKRRILEQALGLAKAELRQSHVADAEARLAALK